MMECAHNDSVTKPNSKYASDIINLIDWNCKLDILEGIWTSREVAVVNESELCKLCEGSHEERAKNEDNTNVCDERDAPERVLLPFLK